MTQYRLDSEMNPYPRCTMLVYGGEYPVRCDRAPVRDGMCERHADAVDARDRKGAHANWKREGTS